MHLPSEESSKGSPQSNADKQEGFRDHVGKSEVGLSRTSTTAERSSLPSRPSSSWSAGDWFTPLPGPPGLPDNSPADQAQQSADSGEHVTIEIDITSTLDHEIEFQLAMASSEELDDHTPAMNCVEENESSDSSRSRSKRETAPGGESKGPAQPPGLPLDSAADWLETLSRRHHSPRSSQQQGSERHHIQKKDDHGTAANERGSKKGKLEGFVLAKSRWVPALLVRQGYNVPAPSPADSSVPLLLGQELLERSLASHGKSQTMLSASGQQFHQL